MDQDARRKACETCDRNVRGLCVAKNQLTEALVIRDEPACPLGKHSVDPVPTDSLSPAPVLFFAPQSQWWAERTQVRRDILAESGIDSQFYLADSKSLSPYLSILEQVEPQIVVNNAMAVQPEVIRELASRYKDTTFITVNHSSLAHTIGSAGCALWFGGHLDNTRRLLNCLYASPDERNELLALAKNSVIWLPNPIRTNVPDRTREFDRANVRVLITCRDDVVKNIPTQVIAAGLLEQTFGHHITLRLQVKGIKTRTRVEPFVSATGMPVEWVPFMERSRFVESLASEVDIVFHASFTESFCYVAMEALLTGCGVVGSPAIRFLPDSLRPNPDSATEISEAANWVISHFDVMSALQARAHKQASELNSRFVKTIRSFITVR